MQGPTPGVTPSSRKQITGTALIVAALVVFMVVVAAVGLVFGGGEEPANPDGFLGYWRATEEAPDGGLWYMRIDQSGDGFLITDSMRAPDEPLAARLDDDVLGITYAEGQKKAYKETYELDASGDRLTLSVWAIPERSDPIISVAFERWDDAEKELAGIEARQNQKVNESAVVEAVHALQVAIQSWAVDHGDQWPRPAVVRADGPFATYIDQWPQNPYTGDPMAPGKAPGDYTYVLTDEAFRLTGHFENGRGFTVP